MISAAAPPESRSSFGPAFFFLPPRRRRALSAVYAFARLADDIADEPSLPPAEKRSRLARLAADIESLYAGGDGGALAWLAGPVREFGLEKEHFLFLIEGMGMDAEPRRYRDIAELKRYMSRVAAAPGLLSLPVLGARGGDLPRFAGNMGCAVQLINIIRDFREDAGMGRVYIPEEDLLSFGIEPGRAAASPGTPDFVELMKFEAGRARGFYREACLAARGATGVFPAFFMGELYLDQLETMEKNAFDGARPRTGAAGKAAAAWRAWRIIC
ncbi:MAG: phytoene synthase [Elusimicrobia bacterium]|nr:MAG: phytoene synthase [Elusimicrobiota bacterium]KAF0154864.1 MAG: phytoene synthase [Elusimicrobiota bacterium]